ncbi:hypothetical protein FRB99_000023 [Tulasnella sp. 403]|nr:hypothetical protein FRB99_000023 [Tulasnella sp. 403]
MSVRRRPIATPDSENDPGKELQALELSPSGSSPSANQPTPSEKGYEQLNRKSRHGIARSRVHVVLSTIFIGLILAVVQRSSKPVPLPDTWALCSKEGSAIYTVDETRPTVECIVTHKERIMDWGTSKEVRDRWGDKDITGPVPGAPFFSAKTGLKFMYLKKGQAAFPGFADAHAHVLQWGATREPDIVGSPSPNDIVQRLVKYIEANPAISNDPTTWIYGLGWDQNLFPGGQFPTAVDLDVDILKGRPIVLDRVDSHVSWVSPRVLEILGDLPGHVEGGAIVRDKHGNATGIFVDNAMNLIVAKQPPWTDDQRLQYFRITARDALAHGLTSIHDAYSTLADVKFFKRLADHGALPLRLNLMVGDESENPWNQTMEKLVGYGNERLDVRSIKLFADGALGSWGAALFEPYSDQPDNRGLMRVTTERLHEVIRHFVTEGWQVNVHCTGDRANHEVLNAFENILPSDPSGAGKHRHRIEHAQVLTLTDIKRLADLGLIASVQPTHATSDMAYAEKRLGQQRIRGAYAWKTLIRHGARLALGSDFPVEGIDPLLGFYAAATRLDVNGRSPHGDGGWYPEERLSREEALHGMTLGAAYAGYQEDIIGSLTPGKRADIVVLDKDIMRIPYGDILGTKVSATIVDGTIAFGQL